MFYTLEDIEHPMNCSDLFCLSCYGITPTSFAKPYLTILNHLEHPESISRMFYADSRSVSPWKNYSGLALLDKWSQMAQMISHFVLLDLIRLKNGVMIDVFSMRKSITIFSSGIHKKF